MSTQHTYVARQCLVSMLSYHPHFIVPSRDTMIQIRRSILGYVFHGNLLRLTDKQGRPIHQLPICDPPIRVLSMPLEDGGVRLPDVEVFSAALLAKTCTRLLEPLFHPWKAIASFRLRSDPEVAVWGLGTAILTSSFDCSSIPSLSDRWVAAITAFRALRVHRIVAPHQLSPQHVLREHLFYNKQICDSGQPLGIALCAPTSLRVCAQRLGSNSGHWRSVFTLGRSCMKTHTSSSENVTSPTAPPPPSQ